MTYLMRVSTIVRLSDRAIEELRQWREEVYTEQYEDYRSHREWLWPPFRWLAAVLTMTPTGLDYEDFKAQVGSSRFHPKHMQQRVRLRTMLEINKHARSLMEDGFADALHPVERIDWLYLECIREEFLNEETPVST